MENEMKANGSGPSVRNVKEDQVSIPVSQHPGRYEEQVEVVESSHHVISTPEQPTCRICDLDEAELNVDLVELGCSCKNEMSRMHRKCILEWYGMRMLLQDDHNCEICKASLHTDTIAVVTEAVSNNENRGRAILIASLRSQLAPILEPMPDIESAIDDNELMEYLMAAKADFLSRLQAGTVNSGNVPIASPIVNHRRLYCIWPFVAIFGSLAAVVGGYLAAIHHYSYKAL